MKSPYWGISRVNLIRAYLIQKREEEAIEIADRIGFYGGSKLRFYHQILAYDAIASYHARMGRDPREVLKKSRCSLLYVPGRSP